MPFRPFTPTLSLPPRAAQALAPRARGRVFLVFPYVPDRFFIKLLTILEEGRGGDT